MNELVCFMSSRKGTVSVLKLGMKGPLQVARPKTPDALAYFLGVQLLKGRNFFFLDRA